ncbi:hypothetical protein ABBQ38_001237 [Trebouxia sp. C0009 RCD-2024]
MLFSNDYMSAIACAVSLWTVIQVTSVKTCSRDLAALQLATLFVHKHSRCIASAASGRGVSDGNVRVGQAAQKTDAQQLSRNLLLVPRATVNVKPNLQIIADDVKCWHGCAVSDLEEDQMFYFRARGIDPDAARQVLVYSFGAEATQHLKHKQLIERIQKVVASTLCKAPLLSGERR